MDERLPRVSPTEQIILALLSREALSRGERLYCWVCL